MRFDFDIYGKVLLPGVISEIEKGVAYMIAASGSQRKRTKVTRKDKVTVKSGKRTKKGTVL